MFCHSLGSRPELVSEALFADVSKWKHLESLSLSGILNMRSSVGLVAVTQVFLPADRIQYSSIESRFTYWLTVLYVVSCLYVVGHPCMGKVMQGL